MRLARARLKMGLPHFHMNHLTAVGLYLSFCTGACAMSTLHANSGGFSLQKSQSQLRIETLEERFNLSTALPAVARLYLTPGQLPLSNTVEKVRATQPIQLQT